MARGQVAEFTHQDGLLRLELLKVFVEHLKVALAAGLAPGLGHGVDEVQAVGQRGVVVREDLEENLAQQGVIIAQQTDAYIRHRPSCSIPTTRLRAITAGRLVGIRAI